MITVKAAGRDVRATPVDPITSGSVGLPVTFNFSNDWDGLTKVAVFRGSNVDVDVALLNDACAVPHECLATAGDNLWIGVYGANGTGTIVIPTIWCKVGHIYDGTEMSGVDPADPTPSWVAQVQAAAASALEKAEAVETAAAAGDFDGADGETAYEYAVSKGYAGTEDDFATLMASYATVAEEAVAAKEAAEDAQEAIEDMSVAATTLEPESSATVTKTVNPDTGAVTLTFGIPEGVKGDTGDTGPAATDAQVTTAVDAWLDENVAQETGYVLDRTLSASNAAAPADLVGDLNDQFEIDASAVIDLSSYYSQNTNSISPSTLKWASKSGRRGNFYAKPQGAEKVTVVAHATNGSILAMTTDTASTSGTYPNYATGTSRIYISPGVTQTVDVPSDCNYFWFFNYDESSTVYLPQSVSIPFVAYTDKTLSMTGKAADAKATGDAIATKLDASELAINGTSSLDPASSSVYYPVLISGSTGKWSSASGRRSYFYPRPALCDHISITANSNNDAVFAMLKDDGNQTGEYPNYATGTSKTTISTGQTQEFDIPSDCNYLYFLGYDGETVYTPSSVTISGTDYTDRTLSLLNKAADAKTTGDAISSAASNINQLLIDIFPAENELPINIAHRGLATSGYPENTMPSFKDAVSKGWKYLETDIRFTSDGVCVLLHDADINRTARNADGTTISGTVNIDSITYTQALDYDFGIYAGATFAGTKIPTLDAFLNFCNKAHVHPVIEVKNSSISQEQTDTVWSIVEKYQMQNRCFWLCSSLGGVEKFLEKNPYAPCIQTSATTWDSVDISSLTPSSTKPYAYGFKTGKNKVFHARLVSSIATKALMDNLVDYYHYFGIYAGVYAPTTQAGIEGCSDRLDMCITQYYKYSDVKAAGIDY